MKLLELLAPAKDLYTGKIAIDNGADALYIGAPRFGARAAVGNSVADIKLLVDYARMFRAKVYVTINTIIFNDEISEVEKLLNELYEINVDAIIIQDLGILKMNIPPIPVFASTQTHNYNIDRIKFIAGTGVRRIILARELSLNQIKEIKNNVQCELEFFIHGSLCVCFSGQCNLSYATTKRSANRGECSQPCRLLYSLEDSSGKIIIKDKYLLSLKDLNLSEYLEKLIEVGITSFKIEGRLKDSNYVKNTTAFYREKLDEIIKNNSDLKKSSGGLSHFTFKPDLFDTYNRGFTNYFIDGKNSNHSSINTPKAIGKYIGKVKKVGQDFFEISTDEKIINGDGLCFFDINKNLCGMSVNNVKNDIIYSNEIKGIRQGTEIFRNHNHRFSKELAGIKTRRKILAYFELYLIGNVLYLKATDEDDNIAESNVTVEKLDSGDFDMVKNALNLNLKKTGNTIFQIENITSDYKNPFFLSLLSINNLRREVLDKLEVERIKNYQKEIFNIRKSTIKFNSNKVDYLFNVSNNKAKEFYFECGANEIEDAFELQKDFSGRKLMTTKYCIKRELKICPIENKTGKNKQFSEPLFLFDGRRKFLLEFNCNLCEMSIYLKIINKL